MIGIKNVLHLMEKNYKMKFHFPLKIVIVSLIGNIVIALGVSTCGVSQMGIDPFTSMNTGVSASLNTSLGIYQAIFNLILFIILIVLNKNNIKYLNIGAFINMFLMGFMVQYFNSIYSRLFSVPSISHIQLDFVFQLIILIIGILLLTLGISLYTTSDLGTGCYDALSIYMAEVLPIKYALCRVITDTVCVIVSYIFTGPLGIATIVLMFFTGPFISTWNKYVSIPLVNKIKMKTDYQ